jgi:hypothetical protein
MVPDEKAKFLPRRREPRSTLHSKSETASGWQKVEEKCDVKREGSDKQRGSQDTAFDGAVQTPGGAAVVRAVG